MSNKVNDELVERAHELLEEVQGHPSGYDKLLARALKHNDLEAIYYWTNTIEAELARYHFYEHGILER